MANPHRGEVELKAGDATYTLSLSINAMCELEAALGKPVVTVVLELLAAQANPTSLRLTTVRAVAWAMLRDHHPDVDLLGAGEIVGEAGFPAAMVAIAKAAQAAFPAAEATKGKPARPRKAGG